MYQIKIAHFDNKKLLKYVNINASQLDDGTIDYIYVTVLSAVSSLMSIILMALHF